MFIVLTVERLIRNQEWIYKGGLDYIYCFAGSYPMNPIYSYYTKD